MPPKTQIVVADYHGLSVSFTDDGWFNATAVAAKHGKDPYEWQRLPSTISYLAAFERKYGKIPYLKTKRGAGGGTWLHPKLAVRFAQWLDDDFAVWCDEQIDSIIRETHPRFDQRRLRHETAASYKVMSQILQESRLAEGKTSAPHHFMTEAKLINYGVSGKFQSLDRDALSVEELDLMARLEVRNTVMIAQNMPYEKRKSVIEACSDAWRADIPKLKAA